MAKTARIANQMDVAQVKSELSQLREEVARLSTLLERQGRLTGARNSQEVGQEEGEEQFPVQGQAEGAQPEMLKNGKHNREHGEQGEQPRIRTDHPHVIRIEGVHGGRPTIRGTGVTVQTIVEQTRTGRSPEGIVEDFGGVLALAQVYDALSYYYEHPGEIEGYITENRAALQKDPRAPVTGL